MSTFMFAQGEPHPDSVATWDQNLSVRGKRGGAALMLSIQNSVGFAQTPPTLGFSDSDQLVHVLEGQSSKRLQEEEG